MDFNATGGYLVIGNSAGKVLLYRLNQFVYNSYVLILILMLLVGGLIQYFLGFPNTVYTILIVGYIWFLVLLHTAVSGKVYISSYLICDNPEPFQA